MLAASLGVPGAAPRCWLLQVSLGASWLQGGACGLWDAWARELRIPGIRRPRPGWHQVGVGGPEPGLAFYFLSQK